MESAWPTSQPCPSPAQERRYSSYYITSFIKEILFCYAIQALITSLFFQGELHVLEFDIEPSSYFCHDHEFFYYDRVWNKERKDYVLERQTYMRIGSSNKQAKEVPNFSEKVRECAKRREIQDLVSKRDELVSEVESFKANREEVLRKEKAQWVERMEKAIANFDKPSLSNEERSSLLKFASSDLLDAPYQHLLGTENVAQVVRAAWPQLDASSTTTDVSEWTSCLQEQHNILSGHGPDYVLFFLP